MAKEKPKPPQKAEILNQEALKGVWVDGIGVHLGPAYVMFEGVIAKPRSEKPIIVTRMMLPSGVFENLVNMLNTLLKEQKKKLKEKEKKPAKK